MIAIEISEIKKIMKELLLKDTFDRFLVTEAVITTFNTFRIDGTYHPEFYEDDPDKEKPGSGWEYSTWKEVKEHCLNLIRGNHLPLKFKLVFLLNPDDCRRLLIGNGFDKDAEDVRSLSFVISYEKHPAAVSSDPAEIRQELPGARMSCISGFSRRSFSMDRSPEQFWDDTMKKFIGKLEAQE